MGKEGTELDLKPWVKNKHILPKNPILYSWNQRAYPPTQSEKFNLWENYIENSKKKILLVWILCNNYLTAFLKLCKLVGGKTLAPVVLWVKDIWHHILRWEAKCIVVTTLNVIIIIFSNAWSLYTEIFLIFPFLLKYNN